MDEKRLQQDITQAVQTHCAHLTADPFLAQRVLREADRKEPVHVKNKLKVGLALALTLMLLAATAVAAVLLSGMELIEQEAVPLAQGNDGEVRPVTEYSHDELSSLLSTAAENGIVITDAAILQALENGEGYSEQEVIMEICRESFGGLYYEWTVEQRHFFQDMMIAIGEATENNVEIPGPNDLASEAARALARETIWKHCGADIPLTDPAKYRVEEDFIKKAQESELGWNWYFIFFPKTLEGSTYYVTMDSQGEWVNYEEVPQSWEAYTERELMSGLIETAGYRSRTQEDWDLNAWYTFGQMLPNAVRTDRWSEEYDAYLATDYLLPAETDMPMESAVALALADSGVVRHSDATALLLGKADQRIWKVSFYKLDGLFRERFYLYEIDSQSQEILLKQQLGFDAATSWRRYVLQETYAAFMGDTSAKLTEADAIALAIQALHKELDDAAIPYADENVYETDVRYVESQQRFSIIFQTKVLAYGNASVRVFQDGQVEIIYAEKPGVDGDTLHSRYEWVYGSDFDWDQSLWVQFRRELEQYEVTTFDAKLFKMTQYPEASAVKLTRDDALDIVYKDCGAEHVCAILIDAQPNPVWKVRSDPAPETILYEIDAMTGEILDKEYYMIQMQDTFDHEMKMYTLHEVFMPEYLAEYGVERVAMELCVKANVDAFSGGSPDDFTDKSRYGTEVDGMTVTFMSKRSDEPSYRVTVAPDGMSAQIEDVSPEDSAAWHSARRRELQALYGEDTAYWPLELQMEFHAGYASIPEEGEMTQQEAIEYARKQLLAVKGEDALEPLGDYVVGSIFLRYYKDIHEITSWTIYFSTGTSFADDGWSVYFELEDGVLSDKFTINTILGSGNG